MAAERLAAPTPLGPIGPMSVELTPRGPYGPAGLEATFPAEFLSPNPFGNMPFISADRLGAISQEGKNRLPTAAHELNHVLAARALDYEVLDVTARPGNGYLGLTTFAGSIDPDHFRIIAAAGAVATPYGLAKGYGHDLAQVHIINTIDSEGTIDGAIENAQGRVNNYPDQVKKKMAEIIVYLEENGWPTIPGFMFDEIIARAELEVAVDNPGMIARIFTPLQNREELLQEYLFKRQHYTQLIDIGDGNGILIEVEGDIIIRETPVCTFCGGENGEHVPSCELIMEVFEQEKVEKKSLPEKVEIVVWQHPGLEMPSVLPKIRTTFSNN